MTGKIPLRKDCFSLRDDKIFSFIYAVVYGIIICKRIRFGNIGYGNISYAAAKRDSFAAAPFFSINEKM